MKIDPDLEAMDRCLAGDKQAFSDLVERHKTVVYSLALRMLGNKTEAEDAAQEAFIKAYTSLHNFRRECSFRNWLCRLTTHLCIDHIRSHQKEKELSSDQEVQELSQAGHDAAVAEQEQLRIALQKLPEHLRSVLILRHLEDLSYQEIAEILQLPLGTVKTHLRRGREALKREMEKFLHEEAQIEKSVREA